MTISAEAAAQDAAINSYLEQVRAAERQRDLYRKEHGVRPIPAQTLFRAPEPKHKQPHLKKRGKKSSPRS